MEEEYGQTVPNMRVLLFEVSVPKALEYKERLKAAKGVKEVVWLDDAVNIHVPLEMAPSKTVEEWYQDGNALFSLTVEVGKERQAAAAVRDVIGEENCMSGPAAESAAAASELYRNAGLILLLEALLVLFLLILASDSWFEPVIILLAIGGAVVMNLGTDLILGSVSFLTVAACPALQIVLMAGQAVHMLRRYTGNRDSGMQTEQAMSATVSQSAGSILTGSLAMAAGFLALTFMDLEIGSELGWAMIKAIACSLAGLLCFLPALASVAGGLLDKTRHRPLAAGFGRFSGFVMKLRIPVLIASVLLVPVLFLAQRQNLIYYGDSADGVSEETQIGKDTQTIRDLYGVSSPVVLMVPRGELEKEQAMNAELLDLDCVTSVISYAGSVGDAIPEEYVSSDVLSRFYSAHYSRFLITLDVQEQDPDWEEKVIAVRNIGEKYYGDEIQYAGDLVGAKDMKTILTQDGRSIILLAAVFLFVILLLIFRSLFLPLPALLISAASVCTCLGLPYFFGTPLFWSGGAAAGVIQAAVTVYGAVFLTGQYLKFRKKLPKKKAARENIKACAQPILISALVQAFGGIIFGALSLNGAARQFGILAGAGAVSSFVLLLFVLPALLVLFDRVIRRVSLHADFYMEYENGNKRKGAGK